MPESDHVIDKSIKAKTTGCTAEHVWVQPSNHHRNNGDSQCSQENIASKLDTDGEKGGEKTMDSCIELPDRQHIKDRKNLTQSDLECDILWEINLPSTSVTSVTWADKSS